MKRLCLVLVWLGIGGCNESLTFTKKSQSMALESFQNESASELPKFCRDDLLLEPKEPQQRIVALNLCADSYVKLEKQRIISEWQENGRLWSKDSADSQSGENTEKIFEKLAQFSVEVGSRSTVQDCFLSASGVQDFRVTQETIVRALHLQIRHAVHFYGDFMEMMMGVEQPPFSRIELCSAPGLPLNRRSPLSLQGSNLRISLGMGLFGLQTYTHNDLMNQWNAGKFENALPILVWPFFNPVGSTRVSLRRATVSIRSQALEYLEILNQDKHSKAPGFRAQLKSLFKDEVSLSTLSPWIQKPLVSLAECVLDKMQTKNDLKEFAREWLGGVAHPAMSPSQGITQTLWAETSAKTKVNSEISVNQSGAWVNVGNWHDIAVDVSWKNHEQDIRRYFSGEPERMTPESETNAQLNISQFGKIVNVFTIDQVRVNVDLSGFFDLSDVFRKPFFAQALDGALLKYRNQEEMKDCF